MPRDGKNNVQNMQSERELKLANTPWDTMHQLLVQFEALSEELFQDPQAAAARQQLTDSMQGLLDQMAPQLENRNSMGGFLPMTAEVHQNIQNQLEQCLRDSRQLPAALQDEDAVKNLRTALVRGRNAMNGLSPEQLPSLSEALSGLNRQVIHRINTEGRAEQGGMSSRIPIEYTDENGHTRRGFLTGEDKPVKSKNEMLKNLAEKYIAKYPNLAGVIRLGLHDKTYIDLAMHAKKTELEEYRIQAPWMQGMYLDHMVDLYTEMTGDLLDEARQYSVLRGARIQTGSQLARRNAAMSDVARRLGFPELLAESRHVEIEQNGQKTRGVVMDAADIDAEDNLKVYKNSSLLQVPDQEFNRAPVLRSLADLQILDYLCGNTDRHKGNFFTRIDTSDPNHPKITGVQGIDNDNSFGELAEGGVARLAHPDNLKVITPEMAAAIEGLTKEDFSELLVDAGLSKREIQAANIRLNTLKSYIAEGRKHEHEPLNEDSVRLRVPQGMVYIVPDKEWQKLSLDRLATWNTKNENIFYQMKREMQERGEKVQSEKKRKSISFSSQDPEESLKQLRASLEEEYRSLREMKKLLKGDCRAEDGGSKNFANLGNKVFDLTEKYERLLKETRNLGTLDEQNIEKLNRFYQELKDERSEAKRFAEAYKKSGFIHITSRSRARHKLASQLLAFSNAPSTVSERLYENRKQGILNGMKAMAQKNAYETSVYAENQIFGAMERTLRANVEKLAGDKNERRTHALGIEALAAQKRLWNFSRSQAAGLKPAENAMKGDGVQEVSIRELEKESARDMSRDVKKILAFAAAQEKGEKKENSLTARLRKEHINPKSMTPRETKRFLSMVFEHEAKLGKAPDGKKKTKTKEKGREK